MKTQFKVLLITVLFALLSCSESDDQDIVIIEPEKPEAPKYEHSQAFPIVYKVNPHEGYLPWPQHDPEFSQEEVNAMINDMVFWSNFANWQGNEDIKHSYLHSGIDILLENGTPIFAVQDGIVRAVRDTYSYGYKQILIEDLTDSNWGWDYVHLAHFLVSEGEEVSQGQVIGFVEFLDGYYEHIHLNRVRVHPDKIGESAPVRWSSRMQFVSGQRYFFRPDEMPPILEPNLIFFRNDTREIIAKNDNPIIHGDVDIAVAARDDSLTSRYRRFNTPSHITPRKIRYEIADAQDNVIKSGQINFDQLVIDDFIIDRNVVNWDVFSLYLHPYEVSVTGWSTAGWSYYILTHFNEATIASDDYQYLIQEEDQYFWDTDLRDDTDMPVYPNGEYTISIYADDFNDNETSMTTTVIVNN